MSALFGKKRNKEGEDVKEIEKDGKAELQSAGSSRPAAGHMGYRDLKAPHVSEKASLLAERGSYVFKVAADANKFSIKKAIGSLYNVKVKKINVINTRPKARRIGMHKGEKSGYKKAVITLAKGQSIDVGTR